MKRILMIGPTFSHATGGIPAVVEGLMKGFSDRKDFDVEYGEYCNSMPGTGIVRRIVLVTGKLFKFPLVLKRSCPDLVHMHTSIRPRGIFRDFFFVLVIKTFGIPLVLELHGGRAVALSSIMRRAFSLLMKLSDGVVLTSKEQREELVSRYPAYRDKIHMIPNPLELPETIVERKRDRAGERVLKIVFASRLIAGKGAAELLEALRELESKNGWATEIYGDGPESDNLRRKTVDLGLAGKVTLRGNIPLEQLLEVYSDSDIFVFPSSHLEGFPMAFFFAVASGMAIVSARTSPVPDYLKEGENCLYADPQDAKGMARAIDRLIVDRELRRSMGLKNSELGRQFRPEHVAASFADLYVEVTRPRNS